MNSAFNKKTVLITGANGFIGSHLARRLVQEGAEVNIFVREGSEQLRIKDVLDKLTVWYGDIRDFSSVTSCLKNSKPQIIYHLAAMRDVNRTINLINQMIDTNIKGTMNIIQAVIENNLEIECFVNTGSSEEYGNGEAPFKESQREKPVSPYSASKVAATYFCQMLHRSFGIPLVTLRPFLTYGPAQDTDMFIPSLIWHCLEKKDFRMTRGDQTREFNYVDDIVDAYIISAKKPDAIGEIINIGNGNEYQIREVAERIVKMMGNPIKLDIGKLDKRPGETEVYCDNKKAQHILGWSPKIDLTKGLDKTIEWFRNYFNIKKNSLVH